jgi:hypothetical protein
MRRKPNLPWLRTGVCALPVSDGSTIKSWLTANGGGTDTVSTTCAVSEEPHAKPYSPSHLIAAYSARAFAAWAAVLTGCAQQCVCNMAQWHLFDRVAAFVVHKHARCDCPRARLHCIALHWIGLDCSAQASSALVPTKEPIN